MLRAVAVAGFVSSCLLAACRSPAPHSPDSATVPGDAALLPARVRRLSNAEYERAASELVGLELDVQGRLPPDVRQDGFTVNAEQALPAAHATRLALVAEQVAKQAVAERLGKLAPCARAQRLECQRSFVEEYARKAFRRPSEPDEQQALLELFEAGSARGAGFAGGVELVLTALLQAPSFLYLRELGEVASDGTRALSSLEMAASLSFLVRGGPPDDELLDVAEAGGLADPEQRGRQARRLLSQSDTRHHFRRFVLEWLEVDDLGDTAKLSDSFPNYETLKFAMLDETKAYVDEVMVHEGASLRSLLTAGFASVNPTLARYYGLDAYGPRVSLTATSRLGLLQQASFLSAHAHEDSSSPVKRGDFVMRKLLCTTLPRPQELNIEVTIPAPDPRLTTRESFSAHVTNESCRGCHAPIDALGFTFENFDAAGGFRRSQNDKPIQSAAKFEHAGEQLAFDDSLQLTRWLARSPTAHDCFARHAFRYFSAQSDPAVERSFMALLATLPEGDRENLIELVVAYVQSDLFRLRGATG